MYQRKGLRGDENGYQSKQLSPWRDVSGDSVPIETGGYVRLSAGAGNGEVQRRQNYHSGGFPVPCAVQAGGSGLDLDRKVQVGKRMTRVYYHLEPAGEQRQRELAQEYEEVAQGVFQIMKGGDNHGGV